jgi:hypothetical protein
MIDPAMTGTFQIELPKDLLAHAKHAKVTRGNEMQVEGWRGGSWLSRLIEKLIGQD